MQNYSAKKRFASASLAVIMAISQVAPTTAFAAETIATETTASKVNAAMVVEEAPVDEKISDNTANTATEEVNESPAQDITEGTSESIVEPSTNEEGANSAESQAVPPTPEKPEGPDTAAENPAVTEKPDTAQENPVPPEIGTVRITTVAKQNGEVVTSRAYGRKNPEFTFELSGLTAEDEAAYKDGTKTLLSLIGFEPSIACEAQPTSIPGDYPIVVDNARDSFDNGNTQYKIEVVPGNLTITKRPVTITVDGTQRKIYGEKDRLIGFTAAFSDNNETIKNINRPTSEGRTDGPYLEGISVVPNREQGESAGEYVTTATIGSGAEKYYDITVVNGTYTIEKAPLTINLQPGSYVYGELPRTIQMGEVTGFQLNDTWESVFGAQTPAFTATKEGTALDAMTEARAPVGTYTVTGTIPEPQNYTITPFSTTLTITKRPLMISVIPNQSKVYGSKDPANFSAAFTAIGKVAGDFANCKVLREEGENAGLYKYDLSQFTSSNDADNYTISIDPATQDGSNSFEIKKAPLTITVPDASKVYGSENPTDLDVSFEGLVNDETINDLNGTLTITHTATKTSGIGDYDIAFDGLTSTNYDIVWKNHRGETGIEKGIGRLTVTPLEVLVKADPATATRKYNKLDDTVSFNYQLRDFADTENIAVVDPEHSPLIISVSCPEWSKVSTKVGSYPIVVSVEENPNYSVQVQNGVVTIISGNVLVTPDQETVVYGDKTMDELVGELTFTANSAQDGTKQYKNGDMITGIGTVKMVVEKDGQPAKANENGTLNAGTYDIAFEITPIDGKTFVYADGKEHNDVDFVVDGKDSGVGRLTINSRPVTFTTVSGLSKQYDDVDPEFKLGDALTGSFAGGNALADPTKDLSEVQLVRTEGEHAGKYAFTGFEGFENVPLWPNYEVSLVNNQFEIVARKVTGTIQNKQKVYGDKFNDSNFSVVLENFKNESERKAIEDSMSYVSVGGAEAAPVGTYSISATFATNKDYDCTIRNGEMTVKPRGLTLSFVNKEKVYGSQDPGFTDYTVDGAINNVGNNTLQLSTGTLTGEVARKAGEDVGHYPVYTSLYNDNYTVRYKGMDEEDNIVTASGNGENVDVAFLNIVAAPLTITVSGPYSIIYGDALPEFTVKYSGFTNGDTAQTALKGELEYVDAQTGESFPARLPAGSYTVCARGLENVAAQNYDLSFVDSTLLVSAREITVKPINAQKIYGENDGSFQFVVTNKEDVLDDVDLQLLHVERAAGEDVGNYSMKVVGEDPNFHIVREEGNFTILPKELTVVPREGINKIYGDENPVLSIADLEFTGFVQNEALHINDDVSALQDSDLTFDFVDGENHAATQASHVCDTGRVMPRKLKNIGAENYTFQYQAAKFTIIPRPITVSALHQSSIYGDEIALDWADYNALNKIVYTGNAEKPALVNGDVLTGSNEIDAHVSAKENVGLYVDAIRPNFSHSDYQISSVAGAFEITPRPLTIDLHSSSMVYGEKAKKDTITAYLYRNDGNEDTRSIVNGDNVVAKFGLNLQGDDQLTVDMIPNAQGNALEIANIWSENDQISDFNHLDFGSHYIFPKYVSDDVFGANYIVTLLYDTMPTPEGEQAPYLPKLKVATRVLTLNITEPKDFTYGDMENPEFEVEAILRDKDLKETPIVNEDDLGIEFGVMYQSFDDMDAGLADIAPVDVEEKVFAEKAAFKTSGMRNAGIYSFKVFLDEAEASDEMQLLLGNDYGVNVRFIAEDDSYLPNGQIRVERRPVAVTMTPNPLTKVYGTETELPTLNYAGFAFDDTFSADVAPEEIINVADAVKGHAGDVGVHQDAFQYVGGAIGNYIFLDAQSDLDIQPASIDEVPDVTVVGSVANADGTVTTNAAPADQFKNSWSVAEVYLIAPDGYEISSSNELDESNMWSDMLIVGTPGKGVTAHYYLRNKATGAITGLAHKSVNIDTTLPVVRSVEVSEINDIRNGEFAAYDTSVDVKLVGCDPATRASVVEEGIMPAFARVFGAPRRAVAASDAPADPNSGVAAVEYYTINKDDAKFDSTGSLVIDTSKFQTVDLTYSDPNNAHGTIHVTPDFVGYIVTRTKDNAGQYSAAAIATISVVAPAAAPVPEQTPNVPLRNSKTGVPPIDIYLIAIAVVSAIVVLVCVSKKKKTIEATMNKSQMSPDVTDGKTE